MIARARNVSLLLLGCQIAAAGVVDDEPTKFFERRIRPILVTHCHECHGADEATAGLRLDSRAGWQAGGDSGPAIAPGDPDRSLLIRAVRYQDANLRMPPEDGGGKLTDRQIADMVTWVKLGAPDPREGRPAAARDREAVKKHWAFQPIQSPAPEAGAHPIDYFIDRRLAEHGFVATPRADRRTLVRRAVFDLWGLPPTTEQLATPPAEFPRLVEQLLSSPRYGERWGRHWLDVARYADAKDGVLMFGDARVRPFAYTYRDYVIRALNEDKPFDRFIHEQLAADQLDLGPHAPELAAMGFLTLGRMFDNNPHDVIDDQIDVVTRGLLGLTVSCARCHDHKFDPIPTADYYSLHGVFASSREPLRRPRIETPTAAGEPFEQELAERLAELRRMQAEQHQLIIRAARARTADYLVEVATTEPDVSETATFFLSLVPEQLRPQIVHRWRQLIRQRAHPDDPIFAPWYDLMQSPRPRFEQWRRQGVDPRVVAAIERSRPQTPGEVARCYGTLLTEVFEAATDEQPDPLRDLLASHDSPVWFPPSQAWYYMSRHDKDKYGGMVNGLDLLAAQSPHAAARAMSLVDAETLVEPVVFRRGDPTQHGRRVPRQFLGVLSAEPREPFSNGSGRLELARAITAPENPLTARVLVNRVWMHHFGSPLVESPSDFGVRTPVPRQLDVLDYLAAELIRGGWRLKTLHRWIMTSAVYQRASELGDDPRLRRQQQADPENSLLWKGQRRRLDMEAMRDGILFVSGQLDLTMYGRPPPIEDLANRRRTIYAFVERQDVPGIVRNFDGANPDVSVAQRTQTTVPQQALFAMNSDFVSTAAERLAERIMAAPEKERVEKLYQAVFARGATPEERRWGEAYLADASWRHYAQVLLMTNEFLFVD